MLKKIAVPLILLLLIVTCVWYMRYVRKTVDGLLDSLHSVEDAANTGNYETLETAYNKFKSHWLEHEVPLGSVMTHDDMDDINMEIEDLGANIRTGTTEHIYASIAKLRYSLEIIREDASINLINIL